MDVPLSDVRVGDLLQVRPGERLPVDGVVRARNAAVDQAPNIGESVPVDKEIGATVFAGTINGEGSLDVEATAVSGDRTLDRMVRIVEEAQAQKAPTQLFTERFERIFVPTVLVVVLLVITVGPLLGIWSWSTAFYRGMTLLVAASPCALALGTPSAVLAGIARAARGGMLIKGGRPLENLGGVRAIAFDKTGTLTVGRPEVTEILPLGGASEDELLRTAAAVEVHSQHPLARAVMRRAERVSLQWPEATAVQSLTARGMRASVDGVTVEVGAPRLWSADGVALPADVQQAVTQLLAAARSVIIVRAGDRWLGAIGVADQLRPEAPAVLAQLRQLGVSPLVMLTGDNAAVGKAVGAEVGVDQVEADLLPESKLERIQALLQAHGNVAMVGDGVNDAPALAYATVGIAMGGAGTAVALETADVALMADDLTTLPRAVELARAARAIIRQNLAISLGTIALLIVATLTGRIGIGLAIIGHEGSTFVVMLNALRLLNHGQWSVRS